MRQLLQSKFMKQRIIILIHRKHEKDQNDGLKSIDPKLWGF